MRTACWRPRRGPRTQRSSEASGVFQLLVAVAGRLAEVATHVLHDLKPAAVDSALQAALVVPGIVRMAGVVLDAAASELIDLPARPHQYSACEASPDGTAGPMRLCGRGAAERSPLRAPPVIGPLLRRRAGPRVIPTRRSSRLGQGQQLESLEEADGVLDLAGVEVPAKALGELGDARLIDAPPRTPR